MAADLLDTSQKSYSTISTLDSDFKWVACSPRSFRTTRSTKDVTASRFTISVISYSFDIIGTYSAMPKKSAYRS